MCALINKNKPSISIITVVFNAVNTVETTIKSVINQSYPNFEYLIIDGGSIDSTLDIIKKYNDTKLRWISQADNGVYDAMNKAIGMAHGDYVYFIGADDVLLDESVVNNFVNSMNDNKITVITVVYNSINQIEQTINNILNIKHANITYIIVDGGSTDGTLDIIKRYQDDLKWVSEKDKGIYDAMNKGWEMADADSHILFINSGDKILSFPQVKLSNDNIYYGNVILSDGRIYNSNVGFMLKIGNTIHHQALMIPKKVSTAPPFNINYRVYADFDFNQKLLKRNIKFNKLDNFVCSIIPEGFSQSYDKNEWFGIVYNNYGLRYYVLSVMYYYFQKVKQLIK